MEEETRIDKFLWSVRIYKTRSQAANACRKGRVLSGDIEAKPSRTVKEGEIFTVKKNPVTFTYRVLKTLNNRVGAQKVPEYIKDLTPEEEIMKLRAARIPHYGQRKRGAGRPTKKERRKLDRLRSKGPSDTGF